MARAQSPTEILLNRVIAAAVTSVLKPAGFRKAGINFHRRRGTTVQVVNIQVSHGSSWNEKRFYINVGIAFDAICDLAKLSVSETPKEYECDDRGMRDRLEKLVTPTVPHWVIKADDNIDTITDCLKSRIEELSSELDGIDGPQAYRLHRWFERFRPTKENAQILYVTGDLDGSWKEVKALAKLFADRINANQAKWWIEKLGLVDLKARLK